MTLNQTSGRMLQELNVCTIGRKPGFSKIIPGMWPTIAFMAALTHPAIPPNETVEEDGMFSYSPAYIPPSLLRTSLKPIT